MRFIAYNLCFSLLLLVVLVGCKKQNTSVNTMETKVEKTAAEILGNPEYLAISYGGYRERTRERQPTVQQLKQDMYILHAMGIRVLRTYNVQLPQAGNLLEAIKQIREEDPSFEMYVMLGAWIDCLNAWTDKAPDHNVESPQNEDEIKRAVALAQKYPDIVKVLAVGNEAMIKWAASYYVQPSVILKWVNHLQDLKTTGELPKDLWITSSDDFASWGGGDPEYHTKDLEALIKSVDYISMHTYPYHNTHYNPEFWYVPDSEEELSDTQIIDDAMQRARDFAVNQYHKVKEHMESLDVDKPIHIGETGWASVSTGYYGANGSRATDEYKQGLYYKYMREWTNKEGISCFYFEAFNEKWKDANNPKGSENHFGLFTIDAKAKYPIWHLVDQGVFKDLTRDGNPITKTYKGKLDSLMKVVQVPPKAPAK